MKETANNFIAIGKIFDPSGKTTDQTGTGIDARGWDEAVFLLSLGVLDNSANLVFKVQDSADNSTFADVTGATYTVSGTADDNTVKVIRVRLNPLRRYVRLISDDTGGTTNVYGALYFLVGPDRQVDQNPNASYTVQV